MPEGPGLELLSIRKPGSKGSGSVMTQGYLELNQRKPKLNFAAEHQMSQVHSMIVLEDGTIATRCKVFPLRMPAAALDM